MRNRELYITCSIGVSFYPYDGQDTQTLLKNAEAAMHRAKELGRNNFQFYATELNTRLGDRLALQTMLRRALDRDEFMLHYQPKIDIRSGRVSGAEALLRWNSPDRGIAINDFGTEYSSFSHSRPIPAMEFEGWQKNFLLKPDAVI